MPIPPLPFPPKQLLVARLVWLAIGVTISILVGIAFTQPQLVNPSPPPPNTVPLLSLAGCGMAAAALLVPILLSAPLQKSPNGALVQHLVSLALAEAVAIIGFVAVLVGGGFENMQLLFFTAGALWVARYPREA